VVSYGDRKTEAFKFENYKLEEIARPAPLIAGRISAERVALHIIVRRLGELLGLSLDNAALGRCPGCLKVFKL
jgi:hypothetical protein